MSRLAAIDYSITSPAICVQDCDDVEDDRWSFFFLNDTKRSHGVLYNGDANIKLIAGKAHPPYTCEMQRYDNISEHFMDIIKLYGIDSVFLEGYSMGSKGRVFNIAENAGILKHKLYKAGIVVTEFPPTVIKKYATGKGNATKEQMYEAFVGKTGIDLTNVFWPNKHLKLSNPVSDVVDSYWIAQCAVK